MKQRIIAGLTLLSAALLSACAEGPAGDRPNLLLITLDTTRADHLSCYGYERETTPNLDRLAREGRLFTNMRAVSSWTLPTHASLFTGLYPSTHGAHSDGASPLSLGEAIKENAPLYAADRARALPDDASTLAEILDKEGFQTCGIGAGPWLKPVFGLAQGFSTYDCDVESTAGRRADRVTDLGLAFLDRLREGPFFLFLNYFDPHAPWDPPPELRFKFFPEEKLALVPSDPEIAGAFDISQYDSEIFFMDQEIGRLLEGLRDRGLYDRTLIVVLGDHGELLGEHGLWWHGFTLFEEEVRIPFLIKDPGAGGHEEPVDRQCQQVDVLPTVLGKVGLSPPEGIEGRALDKEDRIAILELFRNPGNVARFGPRFDRELVGICYHDCKWIRSTRPDDRDAGLFSLGPGLGESEDLTASKPDLAKSLDDRLEAWKRSLRAPLKPRAVEKLDRETRDQLEALGY